MSHADDELLSPVASSCVRPAATDIHVSEGLLRPPNAPESPNPYVPLLNSTADDAHRIQAAYSAHRETRTQNFESLFISSSFTGVTIDPILLRLENPDIEPGFMDTRFCLVTWARPPKRIQQLVSDVQKQLKTCVSNLWLMPSSSLHMTALEIAHSRTPAEIDTLVSQLRPVLSELVNYTGAPAHRARLIMPKLSFDTGAIALTFLPAAGEGLDEGKDTSHRARTLADDVHTYHHFRAALFALVHDAGVSISSRYAVPSAHLTIARFVHASDFLNSTGSGEDRLVVDAGKASQFVETVRAVNAWLEAEFWPKDDGSIPQMGEWVVGEERGLESRRGAVWYGSGGELLMQGEGF